MTDEITYAVGDVHGCLAELREVMDWAAEDAAGRGARGLVVLLGDYVDRGPDSRGVLDFLMAGPADAHMEWKPLAGNHDDMLVSAWLNPTGPAGPDWWEHGGQQTLMSYGWSPARDPWPNHLGQWIHEDHVRFLSRLPLLHEDADRIFVHAGLRPGVALADQSRRDMTWIRGEFLKSGHDFGRTVVHGHTPSSANPAAHPNRVAMDSGCFAGGRLSAAAFEPGSPEPRFFVTGDAPGAGPPAPR